MNDSSVSTVLTSLDLMTLAEELRTDVMNSSILVFSSEESLAHAAPWPPPELMTDSPFYIIYTSVSEASRRCRSKTNMTDFFFKGSTGKPKGVLHTHQTTRAMLSTHNAIHELSPSDKVLSQSSLAFDLSVAQIWGAFTAGATLLLAKNDARKEPGNLAGFKRRAGVTVTYFTAPTTSSTQPCTRCPRACPEKCVSAERKSAKVT